MSVLKQFLKLKRKHFILRKSDGHILFEINLLVIIISAIFFLCKLNTLGIIFGIVPAAIIVYTLIITFLITPAQTLIEDYKLLKRKNNEK